MSLVWKDKKELLEINDDYEIEVFLPGHIIIGSNGGGELYGIDNKGNYFNVPVLIDEEDVVSALVILNYIQYNHYFLPLICINKVKPIAMAPLGIIINDTEPPSEGTSTNSNDITSRVTAATL